MPWRSRVGTTYDHLNATHVLRTVDRLQARIAESFPQRHLADVAGTLAQVLQRMLADAGRSRPVYVAVVAVSRLAIVVLVALSVLTIVLAMRDAFAPTTAPLRAFEWLPILESGINDVVFAGLAIWFLLSVEDRMERRRLLATLHRLRSLAHVVDMHQMSKDPTALLPSDRELAATGAPAPVEVAVGVPVVRPALTREEFAQYLDYCSELLSLVGKGAALCAETSTDAVVLDTVSELETLTTGMSRKIWQKITLLHRDGSD